MSETSKHLEKAEKYLQKGRQADALAEYMEALREDPTNENVHQTAADLSIALGNHSQAIDLLTNVFEHQATVGDASKAIANYKKLARLTTPSVDHTFRYAQMVEKTSRRDALECYDKVVRAFTSAGRKADALAALKRVVALDATENN